MESAHKALEEPSKLIDGRLAVCNLACEGLSSVCQRRCSSEESIHRRVVSRHINGIVAQFLQDLVLSHTRQPRMQRRLLMIQIKFLGKEHHCEACRYAAQEQRNATSGACGSVAHRHSPSCCLHSTREIADEELHRTSRMLLYPYPSPYPNIPPHYSMQTQVPYQHVGGRKDPYGIPSASPTGVSLPILFCQALSFCLGLRCFLFDLGEQSWHQRCAWLSICNIAAADL
ncbi:hypothetical protein HPP92_017241 [Vanilla planifolia]|uniref:Uncharacterized protein n=1 Tax=Vanilla planifolia TaxID=51239 RepID=A0A835QFP5_VANPL|nr:hypothetical protein HPP92_017241 [Vanilla planifolia]